MKKNILLFAVALFALSLHAQVVTVNDITAWTSGGEASGPAGLVQ